MRRYFLRLGIESSEEQEVTLAQFREAEHSAGFHGGSLERGTTATSSFSGRGVCGRVDYGWKESDSNDLEI